MLNSFWQALGRIFGFGKTGSPVSKMAYWYQIKEFNEFERALFERMKDEVSRDEAFFRLLLKHARKMHGLFVLSEASAELFQKIMSPEIVNMKRMDIADDRYRASCIMGKYNNAYWCGDETEITRVLSQAATWGVDPKCLVNTSDPFLTRSEFLDDFRKMRDLLEKGDAEAAYSIFTGADKSRQFTPIELLALKAYYLETRKVHFLALTNPDYPRQTIEQIRQRVVSRVSEFITIAENIKGREGKLLLADKKRLLWLAAPYGAGDMPEWA